MRIGIIGPGEVKKYCDRAELDIKKYSKIVEKLAGIIAKSGNEIVITPDKGSTSELFGNAYKTAGGKKITVIAPLEDKEFGYSWVNTEIGNSVKSQFAYINICDNV